MIPDVIHFGCRGLVVSTTDETGPGCCRGRPITHVINLHACGLPGNLLQFCVDPGNAGSWRKCHAGHDEAGRLQGG